MPVNSVHAEKMFYLIGVLLGNKNQVITCAQRAIKTYPGVKRLRAIRLLQYTLDKHDNRGKAHLSPGLCTAIAFWIARAAGSIGAPCSLVSSTALTSSPVVAIWCMDWMTPDLLAACQRKFPQSPVPLPVP